MKASEALKNRPSERLLRVQDVPSGGMSIDVIGVMSSPKGVFAPFCLRIIPPIPGKDLFGVNVTNMRILSELLGDEMDEWKGHRLHVAPATFELNSGESVRGLQVIKEVEIEEEKPAPRTAKK